MNFGDHFVGVRGDHRERANPLARRWVFPVLPDAADAERLAVLHGDGKWLLGLLAFDRLPLVKSVDRQDAVPPAVGFAEHRQLVDGLALGVDGLAPALGVFAPIRNEPPAQRVEGDLSRLMIAPDHQEVLARRAVPAGWEIVAAAVARIEAFYDAIPQWSAALDYPPAHEMCVRKAKLIRIRQIPCFRHKKEPPGSPGSWGLEKLLPQLRLLCWAAGVSGDGGAVQTA